MNHRAKIAVAGLAFGLLAVLVLPASWLFTEDLAGMAAHGEGAQFACPMFCVVLDELPEDARCPVCAAGPLWGAG